MDTAIKTLLLCVDGEPHSDKAVRYAIDLAAGLNAEVTALYVVDPFLQKFTHEIYAVNRAECRAHLERALTAEGQAALDAFAGQARRAGIRHHTRMRQGDPLAVILAESASLASDLVVLGGKPLKGWHQRFASRKLPERLNRVIERPLLVVR
ncbi:MAG: universal stress protein [Pseudomonadota bacterium]